MQDDELNKTINNNNNNNANNEQLVDPGTYTHVNPVNPEPPAPMQVPTITPQEPPKKSILYRIVKYSLFALFALFLIGSIASLFVDEDASNTQNNTEEIAIVEDEAVESIDHPILNKINADLIDKKIVDKSYENGGAVFLPVNDEFNFYITDKSPQNKYLLDKIVDIRDAFEGCESENSINTFATTKSYFEEANYTVFESSAYAGGYGCTRVQLATNDTDICSLVINEAFENLGSSQNEGIILSVFCGKRDELKEEIVIHQEVLRIINDTEQSNAEKERKEFTALRDGYIKYDTDYDVAVIVQGNGFESFYYKNNTLGDDSSKWVRVDSDGVSCEVLKTGLQDIYEAFKGQECFSINENKRIILE